tara:strand:+ start:23 stop:223 length:201 start_codon:yes stop_codon:yes gene_type:complete
MKDLFDKECFKLQRGDLVRVKGKRGQWYRGLVIEKRPQRGWMLHIPGGTDIGLHKMCAMRQDIYKV